MMIGKGTQAVPTSDNVLDAMISAALSPATIRRAYNVADGTGTSWQAYVAACIFESRVNIGDF